MRSSVIVGAAATGVGVLGMYGALTGRITSMMAAIWYPNLLVDGNGNSVTTGKKAPGTKKATPAPLSTASGWNPFTGFLGPIAKFFAPSYPTAAAGK